MHNSIENTNCSVCFEPTVKRKISCGKCGVIWCAICYKMLTQFASYQIKCPHCKIENPPPPLPSNLRSSGSIQSNLHIGGKI